MKPFSIVESIRRRAADAVIAQSGIAHRALAQEVRRLLADGDPRVEAILQKPIIEGAYPYETADVTFGSLSGNLLDPNLVDVLDGSSDTRHREYRFQRHLRPYAHQFASWQTLLGEKRTSLVVTSGTGSGKTECFLIPILQELARKAEGGRVEGVEAIMLYPLNALIESQKQRLSEWTAPFDGRVRYCLYNGNLAEDVKDERTRTEPWEVHDRRSLRSSPPPILVTNITMLEYMLMRPADEPILRKSQGRLKWIILDEAHTLVGAAAAEVALLLRRVLMAFGVRPRDVRFVATSATIGEGVTTRAALQSFLADLAGVPTEEVTVIEGHRRFPVLPTDAPTGDKPLPGSVDDRELYDHLTSRKAVRDLVQELFSRPVSLDRFEAVAQTIGVDASHLADNLSRATTRNSDGAPGDRLAPLRVHAFQRAMPGLWSCINPECGGAPTGWPFGRVLTESVEQCPSCASIVLEILSCTLCGEPLLEGEERNDRISAKRNLPPEDEFRDEAEREQAGDEFDEASENKEDPLDPIALARLFPAVVVKDRRPLPFDKKSGTILPPSESEALTLHYVEAPSSRHCPCCGERPRTGSALRPLRFGAPFFLGNAAPILLQGVPPEEKKNDPLPSGGRRLLSFTDSRQGTARLSAKLQTEAERNFVRSFIYHAVQEDRRPDGDAAEVQQLRKNIAELERAVAENPDLRSALTDVISGKRETLIKLTDGNTSGLAWSDLRGLLAERLEVSDWIHGIWEERDVNFADVSLLADFLLLREFARRPKRANSVETLGLASLRCDAIEKLGANQLPAALKRRGKTSEDWKSFLYGVLTFMVRANSAIHVPDWMQNWIMPKTFPQFYRQSGSDIHGLTRAIHWPSSGPYSSRSRAVLMLRHGLNLNQEERSDRDDLNECLEAAWGQLAIPMTAPSSAERALNFSTMRVAPLTHGWLCPVTQRVIDTAPFGLSPYSLGRAGRTPQQAESITLPRLPRTVIGAADLEAGRSEIANWLANSREVATLREKGGWRDINERVALFADYARSAEHSAQQDAPRLRDYQEKFQAGRINILNCSTTMEMGVDIGSVSAVMMTNVPPSIANYRQRIGRAGRRGQPMSLAFTFAKDRPLDRAAFRDPEQFLARTVAAPRVSLNSRPIVQRHINAYLLSAFMRQVGGNLLTLEIGSFLGCPADPESKRTLEEQRPASNFQSWLSRASLWEEHAEQLETLVRSSILEGDRGVVEQTANELTSLETAFVAEWQALREQASEEDRRPGSRTGLRLQLQRVCKEFLPGALADRGFLPGHGFPTDVVSFLPHTPRGRSGSALNGGTPLGENPYSRRGGPQRQLEIAIRDYAPGSEVVLDGLVHRSAGVTLNWQRPASDDGVRAVQSLRHHWRCSHCGSCGSVAGDRPQVCEGCGEPVSLTQHFLRPAGFSVDTGQKPHAEVDTVTYVPPEEPVVSAGRVVWSPLPLPERGRIRASREGRVFYSSTGAERYGYAICLHCGRAEAEDGPAYLNPALPRNLRNHSTLRSKRGGKPRCEGNEQAFAIQRHLALGHEITTDVFELQPAHRASTAAANALAIALRESLAQMLGVEASDIGFAVQVTKNLHGGDTRSIFLFDRSSGGAGFSVGAEYHLQGILHRAREILSCSTPGCETACPACVLVFDAPEEPGSLDRKQALAFLDTQLNFGTGLDPADAVAPNTRLSVNTIDELDRALGASSMARLTLFSPVVPDPTLLPDWRLASALEAWAYRGRRLRLMLPRDALIGLDAASMLALRDLAVRFKFELAAGPAPTFPNGAISIAAVEGKNSTTVWACRDVDVGNLTAMWGQSARAPVVYTECDIEIGCAPLERSSLEPPPGAQYREIARELDGAIDKFGDRAARLLQTSLKKAGAWPNAPIFKLIYEDAYVKSPLNASLLIGAASTLVRLSGGARTPLEIRTPPLGRPHDLPPRHANHDWKNENDRVGVLVNLGKQKQLDVAVTLSSVPHGRRLLIEFADGSRAQIILDQGFGAWSFSGQVDHPFRETPERQVAAILRWQRPVSRRGVGSTYLVVTK